MAYLTSVKYEGHNRRNETKFDQSLIAMGYADTVFNTTDPYIQDMDYFVRGGTVTPNYHSLARKGRRLPYNPFNYRKVVRRVPLGFIRREWKISSWPVGWGHQTITGMVGGLWDMSEPTCSPMSGPRLDALENKAIISLRLKMKDQKVNLAQTFAERSQTARLIGDSAIKIAKSLHALKRGDLKQAAQALALDPPSARAGGRLRRGLKSPSGSQQALSRAWLELQYGWLPLLSDVYGSAEMLAQKNMSEVITKVRVKKTDTEETRTSVNFYTGVEGKTVNVAKATISYVCEFSLSSNENVHTLSQVGITNPLLLMWELLPWSFVIDWFLPMGNYISSLDATMGLVFVGGSRTIVMDIETVRNYDISVKYNNDTSTGNAKSSKTDFSVGRSTLTSFPVASLPSFKNPLSFVHALNGIALLRQLRK